ncbi:nucleotidyl transferase AbiEii/AbiGii toxin family protein [Actinomycetospora soli]|uniref:nucleotidyl transferase AbiEii/AbiGii toxin family protein n=1 Tax=Actinomycetospora soli TaxID=2893887 RepID=UPI001E2B1C8E|nr:nucleotidyl transferase AbiEii/AbiGii toxin family protein [Actinomycetospora soli]MCD2186627.1 nucleotidyl transferase AbiEii/AbiGii toxin family protein [Actinomycetospora soli]
MAELDPESLRRLASMLLGVVGPEGFALAGAGAVREHGLTSRPTHDVDLFAFSTLEPTEFDDAVLRAENELRAHGYVVVRTRSFPLFARLHVVDPNGNDLEVDLGVNWRSDTPVVSSIGPVLSESDAVAGKLSAVYSRREVRDFLDLDAIRRSGRYTDADLLALGKEHDDGFDVRMFAESLSTVRSFLSSEAEEYGFDAASFADIRDRIYAWAEELRNG